MSFSIFHLVPLWLDFVIFLAVLLVALEVGYRIGVRRQHAWKSDEIGGGRISLTSMFAVLGLMLAFTFGAAINRHEARKKAIVAETNALGTAFLHASLAKEPGRSELRAALLDYARTRTSGHSGKMTVARLESLIRQSWDAKAKLWPATERIVKGSAQGPIEAALVQSVTKVLDSDTNRVAAVLDSLPPMVLTLLLLIAAATVSVAGFNAGLSGKMSRLRTSLLILVLASIMLVIIDFDRSSTGFIQVRDNSLRAAISEMEESLAQPAVDPAKD
ncbi:hypothetical protein [Haloferula sp. A504]|uniref:bestrophin-like domain n=1 Tax=Haloferula sp. A504 TaxID=3373601 RepID=UPI0031C21963|nr:hypothetical protein [Verrucomicrobiaceae bacterium E54]